MQTLLNLLTLEALKGKRTYLSAAALVALAVLEATNGNTVRSAELMAAALAAIGIRGAVKSRSPNPSAGGPSSVAGLATALVLFGATAMAGDRPGIPTGPNVPPPGQLIRTPNAAPMVRAVEPPFPIFRVPKPDLTKAVGVLGLAESRDWGHQTLKLVDAQKVTRGKGARVAVLDTGADLNHPDLKGRIVASKDFTGSRFGAVDVHGHGTHCAGIIGASGAMIGVAPECDLIVGKVLGDNGTGDGAQIASGIRWAVEQRAHIISMSLGAQGNDSRIEGAIRDAQAAGVVVVVASGNDGPSEGSTDWPGALGEIVTVAAVGRVNGDAARIQIAKFSSRGKAVVVAAPGVEVLSLAPGGQYVPMSGTSMATPYVAGVLALDVAARLDAGLQPRSPKEVLAAIGRTARDLPPTARDTASGFGLVDVLKLFADRPVVTPPTERFSVTLTEQDLTAEGRAKLQGAAFTITIQTPGAPKPMATVKPIEPTSPPKAKADTTPAYPAPPGDGWKWSDNAWRRPAPAVFAQPVFAQPVFSFPFQSTCPGGVCPRR